MKHVNGQQSLFDDIVFVEEAKPAKKQPKPKANEYPFQCNIHTRYVIVYAQHPAHAYRKCQGMYGCCIGTPVQM